MRGLTAGALLCTTVASGAFAQSATTYTYDALGRLTVARDGTGYRNDYVYDAASNRSNASSANQFEQSFAANALYHITGHVDGDAWAAAVEEPEGHMVYGPYTYNVSSGSHVAAYRMLIDNNIADDAAVAIVDVADGSNGASIVSRTLYRRDWKTAGYYEVFELPFDLTSQYNGHPIEFRIYYLRRAYLRVEKVGFR